MRSLVASVFALWVSGCGASGFYQSQVIYSAENNCSESETQAEEVGQDIYVVTGCGFRQVFSCLNVRSRNANQSDTCQPTGPKKPILTTKKKSDGEIKVGTEVEYQASDGQTYSGIVEKLDGTQVSVRTTDGKHQWVRSSALRRTISAGAPVEYLASDGNWYPGTVDSVDGEQVSVRTRSGEHYWLPKASVRLRADRLEPVRGTP